MTYDLLKTAGGNAYLGPNGTFAQLVDGFKAMALNRDDLDSNFFKIEALLGVTDLNLISRGIWTQPYQGNATLDRHYPQEKLTGVLFASNTDPNNQIRQTFISTLGMWHRVRVDFNWTPWRRLDSVMDNRGLLGATNLDDIADGFWMQPYSSGAKVELSYPATTSGFLVAVTSSAPSTIWQLYSADVGRGLWRRKRGMDYKWEAWERVDSTITNRGLIGATHLDQVIDEGTWYQRYSSGATPELGYPVKSPGQLEVRTLYAASGERSQTYWPSSASMGVWRRTSTASKWGPWEKINGTLATGSGSAPEDAGSTGTAAVRRMARVSTARKRLLGGAGTNGAAAIALRFDDGHDVARDKVLPILRKYGLPGFWAVSGRYLNESTVKPTDLRAWAHNDGVEVTSHSRGHADATGEPAVRDSIYTWADDLETLVGGIVVDTWTFPGGGDYDGLNAGKLTSSYPNTYAGRLLMERYAAPYGGSAGWLQPLTGEPTIGQSHITIETYDLAKAQNVIRKAQASGMGLVLMLHPTKLDTEGAMTTDTLDRLCAWIAAERDADRLLALTGTGLAFAHPGPRRANIIPALAAWSTTGWTVESTRVYTAGTTVASTSVEIEAWAGSRGAPMELLVPVSASSQTVVRVRVTAAGGAVDVTKDVTITGPTRIYQPFTLPTTAALNSTIDVSVTRVSGGTLTLTQPRMQTI